MKTELCCSKPGKWPIVRLANAPTLVITLCCLWASANVPPASAAPATPVAEQYQLGRSYEHGIGVRPSSRKAAKWYKEAAERGFAPAQYSLGRLYSSGEGVRQDYAQAIAWFRKAAAQGCALAQNRLGVMHERGLGVPKDYGQAIEWYRLAAKEKVNIFATANLESLQARMTAEELALVEQAANSALSQYSPKKER